MSQNRRQYDPSFKARVVLHAMREQETIPQLAARFGVHPCRVKRWKKQAVELLPTLFDKHGEGTRSNDELVDRLYQEIGRLQVELAWLKS